MNTFMFVDKFMNSYPFAVEKFDKLTSEYIVNDSYTFFFLTKCNVMDLFHGSMYLTVMIESCFFYKSEHLQTSFY